MKSVTLSSIFSVSGCTAAILIVTSILLAWREIRCFRNRHTPGHGLFISTRHSSRRLTMAILIFLLGVMVFAGEVIDLSRWPIIFGIYLITCVLLVFWLSILAVFDFRDLVHFKSSHRERLLSGATYDIIAAKRHKRYTDEGPSRDQQ